MTDPFRDPSPRRTAWGWLPILFAVALVAIGIGFYVETREWSAIAITVVIAALALYFTRGRPTGPG